MDWSSFTFLLISDIYYRSLDEGSSALASNEVKRNAASSLDLLGLKLPAMPDRASQLRGGARYRTHLTANCAAFINIWFTSFILIFTRSTWVPFTCKS